jgi:hypothetical protein
MSFLINSLKALARIAWTKKKNVMIISVGVTEVDKIGILTIKVK